MRYKYLNVTRVGREFIGGAITRVLNERLRLMGDFAPSQIVSIVPRMTASFAGDTRREITEVDIILLSEED